MDSEQSFDEVMQRLRQGDQDAAAEVFARFAHRLMGLARSRLNATIRGKVDPEDVMQSVFNSFFRRQAEERFEFVDWGSLWALLALITIRKCGHRIEHFGAASRDVGREISFTPLTDESSASWAAVATEPSPSQAAILTETVEQLMRPLNDSERQMLSLSLQGYTPAEIAPEVTRSERTVRRVLERVRGQLERMRAAG